jgi:hypothetical protein
MGWLQRAAQQHSANAARLRYTGTARWHTTRCGPHDRRRRVAHRETSVGAAHAEVGEGSAPGAGAAMVGRILASAVGEVGRGRWLGQHSEMGDSIEAS